jgi:OmpA-OmpF porin, OOP family
MRFLATMFFIILTTIANAQNYILPGTEQLVEQKEKIIKENTIIKIENLGEKINTHYPELRPTISADGSLLFFIRQGHPANAQIATVPNAQDVWYSSLDTTTNTFTNAKHLNGLVNASHFNAVFWISPDMNKLLIKGAYLNGQYLGFGVSMLVKNYDNSWSQPQALQVKKLDKMLAETQQFGASMGQDGKTLLLYIGNKKDYGNDLYISFYEGNDIWSAPKSLGKTINSKYYDEKSPFLAADNKTLYFSSQRDSVDGGLGGYDIYQTKRLDDSWTKWSTPQNLGTPINTEGNEDFFTTDAGGQYAYLTSSNGAYGGSDIVRVKLLEKEKPDPVIIVTGNVYNAKTKQPLQANLVYETLPNGVEAGTGLSNATDGGFKIVLPYNFNYSIRANADKFFSISENLNLDSLIKEGFTQIHKDLYLAPIEIGQVYRLNNVFFDFDKYNLRPESFVELDRVVAFLNQYPNIEIEMSAHTDSKGADDYNFKLSDNRANSVMQYILSKGIKPHRIKAQGYGETKPVSTNDTNTGRQNNRRVEFTIVKN